MPNTVFQKIIELVKEGYEVIFEQSPTSYFMSAPTLRIRIQAFNKRIDHNLDIYVLAEVKPSPEQFVIEILSNMEQELKDS